MDIKVKDFMEIIPGPARVRIIKEGQPTITCWGSSIPEEYHNETMKGFKAAQEIRHKDWKELGLMEPTEPDKTPDYRFSDLEMKLYYEIKI